MAKNFSVAWLSQSSHSSTSQQDKPFSLDGPQSHLQSQGSCLVTSQTQTLCVEYKEEIKLLHNLDHGVKDIKIDTPSSPTNSCGYTSGSESDVCDDSEGETGPNRRVRTKFTTYQISRLEKTFNKHKYLGATQRKKIAEKLHLSETQVKTWFQNRRMKLKREVQDSRVEYFSPAMMTSPLIFPASPSFQHHHLNGQRPSLQLYHQQLQQQLHHQQRVRLLAQQPAIHPTLLLKSSYY
ncbi:homeobox protein vent1 [Astyanax mexicanus]|uniref:Homeobox protein vent1 n=1 Tax=Astyanax mexicanus TaxID=7994 RepID=A0A8B9H8L8_ASTMX|nr:homeobox protein vent1 [Astyanax mexicanus]